MARYIDADKLIKTLFPIGLIDDGKYTINAKAVKYAIDNTPTADVVPKSEVERLKQILNSYALQYGTVTDKQKVIDKAKSEALSDLKKQIHDRAVYAYDGIDPYISIKVFDAVINKLIGS